MNALHTPAPASLDPEFKDAEEFASWWLEEERRVRQEAIENGHGPDPEPKTRRRPSGDTSPSDGVVAAISEPTPVSLDEYRTGSVAVFGGTERGRRVAEDIKDQYGSNVEVEVPADVLCVSTHFRAGFHEVLPEVSIPDV